MKRFCLLFIFPAFLLLYGGEIVTVDTGPAVLFAETLEPDGPPAGYPELAAMLAEMNAAAADYPSICQIVDLTTTYNTPTTFEGRHLFAVKISDNVNQNEDEPSLLLVSNHHAREIVPTVIAMYAIR